jgi:hypothetical protein
MARKYTQKIWSKEDDEILRVEYATLGYKHVAKRLNRTKCSVITRANRLGLKSDYRSLQRGVRSDRYKGYAGITGTYWNNVRHNAKSRDLPFTISIEYAWRVYEWQGKKCALTGIPIEIKARFTCPDGTASLDRIDSTKGYVEGNIQWIHKDINQMKWDLDQGQFVVYCRLVARESMPKTLPPMGSWDGQMWVHPYRL